LKEESFSQALVSPSLIGFMYENLYKYTMSLTWFLGGFSLGLLIGAGIVLLYIKMKFTQSLNRFEQEMDFLEEMEDEMNLADPEENQSS
jgi:hypothetical protein